MKPEKTAQENMRFTFDDMVNCFMAGRNYEWAANFAEIPTKCPTPEQFIESLHKPDSGWIPCSERLPEAQGGDDVWKKEYSVEVLVWMDGYDIGVYWPKLNQWRIRNRHGDWKPKLWKPIEAPTTNP